MEKKNLLDIFATHPVAMNILMTLILVLGLAATYRINTQFFPNFDLDYVAISTSWPGATAEDVESSISHRIELELKSIDNLKDIRSTSRLGSSNVVLEFNAGTDISEAVDDVKSMVDLVVPDLPEDAEQPEVTEIVNYEPIANLIITGDSMDQLRVLAYETKDELLSRGTGKVDIIGLPDEEIVIQVSSQTLRDLGLTLNQIGQRIRSNSRDSPLGISGRDDAARLLRIIDQRRSELSFESLPVIADSDGRLVSLADIATIEKRPKSDQLYMTHRGRPAVELKLQRLDSSDTLETSAILQDWLKSNRPFFPPGVEVVVYDDQSIALRDRINVLLKNGVAGLILVLIVLYLFLNARLAFWVAMGIPVSLLGAAGILYLIGGTLNMITLFGFIMTIGIIVDDAIVVGEEAVTRFIRNQSPAEAACRASRRMFLPIIAASLTTIFAFMPVIVVSGVFGVILGNIALVVICVVAMSLVEAFFILPGHLHHSFQRIVRKPHLLKRTYLDRQFTKFRDGWYQRVLTLSIDNPITTIAAGVSILILTVGLFASGRLSYDFFPTPELNLLYTNVSFNAGTPRAVVNDYLQSVEDALLETEQELGGDLIHSSNLRYGALYFQSGAAPFGENYGSVVVELIPADERTVRANTFREVWSSKLERVPSIENVVVITSVAGPPVRDIEIRLSGPSTDDTKNAALALKEFLQTSPGVYGVEDDTSYGRQQQVLSLTALGRALGLSVNDISQQLRTAIAGELLQTFATKYEDVDVKLMLPDEERDRLNKFEDLHIRLPSGESAPLLDVVSIRSTRGFDTLRHSGGEFAIEVLGSVDRTKGNASTILNELNSRFLPELEERYGVSSSFGLRQADQAKTESSMKTGALIALVLIYLTLAWIFSSYSWPIFVMLAIPFGIVGAAWGHVIVGLTLTIITILGLIGLSGIVVNNAIVLVVFYKQNRESGKDVKQAMIEAGCQRLRPVILSSLTTIAGLLPLLFEKSTQAQFLIPMAVTLAFGLAFSTVLVLLFIPAVLALYEKIASPFRDTGSVEPTVEMM